MVVPKKGTSTLLARSHSVAVRDDIFCKGSVDTTILGVDTMVQNKGRNVKKSPSQVDTSPEQVDTRSSQVDTRDLSQGVVLLVWDSVLTHLMGRSTHSGIFVSFRCVFCLCLSCALEALVSVWRVFFSAYSGRSGLVHVTLMELSTPDYVLRASNDPRVSFLLSVAGVPHVCSLCVKATCQLSNSPEAPTCVRCGLEVVWLSKDLSELLRRWQDAGHVLVRNVTPILSRRQFRGLKACIPSFLLLSSPFSFHLHLSVVGELPPSFSSFGIGGGVGVIVAERCRGVEQGGGGHSDVKGPNGSGSLFLCRDLLLSLTILRRRSFVSSYPPRARWHVPKLVRRCVFPNIGTELVFFGRCAIGFVAVSLGGSVPQGLYLQRVNTMGRYVAFII
ncbi:hypothetical protein Taro_025421 [Colocasia esculenta]|uniref:Uncharacterized protein n=1 Tax=Colocasia esculenta TaxID=4460 RepID=A0A843V8U9_COLES|nr:hypothetical protein [Colocasia esculenta]